MRNYKIGDYIVLKISEVREETGEYCFEGINNLCLTNREVDNWNHYPELVKDIEEQLKPIEVGDVIYSASTENNVRMVVTHIRNMMDGRKNYVGILRNNGEMANWAESPNIRRTGEHVDLSGIIVLGDNK